MLLKGANAAELVECSPVLTLKRTHVDSLKLTKTSLDASAHKLCAVNFVYMRICGHFVFLFIQNKVWLNEQLHDGAVW